MFCNIGSFELQKITITSYNNEKLNFKKKCAHSPLIAYLGKLLFNTLADTGVLISFFLRPLNKYCTSNFKLCCLQNIPPNCPNKKKFFLSVLSSDRTEKKIKSLDFYLIWYFLFFLLLIEDWFKQKIKQCIEFFNQSYNFETD